MDIKTLMENWRNFKKNKGSLNESRVDEFLGFGKKTSKEVAEMNDTLNQVHKLMSNARNARAQHGDKIRPEEARNIANHLEKYATAVENGSDSDVESHLSHKGTESAIKDKDGLFQPIIAAAKEGGKAAMIQAIRKMAASLS